MSLMTEATRTDDHRAGAGQSKTRPEKAETALSLEDMQCRAGEVAGLLRTLAHPSRLMLVCTLVEGEFSVGALEERVGLHQPNLSQHLTVLRRAGVVKTRREAKQIFYSLTGEKPALVVDALHRIFCTDKGNDDGCGRKGKNQ